MRGNYNAGSWAGNRRATSPANTCPNKPFGHSLLHTHKHTLTHPGPATSWHLSGHWHVLPCELVWRRRRSKHFVNVTFPLWTEERVTFYPWNVPPTTHTPATPPCGVAKNYIKKNTHKVVLLWSDMNSNPFVSSVFVISASLLSVKENTGGVERCRVSKSNTRNSFIKDTVHFVLYCTSLS